MKENGVMLMWVDRVGVDFNNAFISINNLVILIERRYNLC